MMLFSCDTTSCGAFRIVEIFGLFVSFSLDRGRIAGIHRNLPSQSTGEGTVGGPVSQEPCFAPARTPNEFISTCQTYVAGEKHDWEFSFVLVSTGRIPTMKSTRREFSILLTTFGEWITINLVVWVNHWVNQNSPIRLKSQSWGDRYLSNSFLVVMRNQFLHFQYSFRLLYHGRNCESFERRCKLWTQFRVATNKLKVYQHDGWRRQRPKQEN